MRFKSMVAIKKSYFKVGVKTSNDARCGIGSSKLLFRADRGFPQCSRIHTRCYYKKKLSFVVLSSWSSADVTRLLARFTRDTVDRECSYGRCAQATLVLKSVHENYCQAGPPKNPLPDVIEPHARQRRSDSVVHMIRMPFTTVSVQNEHRRKRSAPPTCTPQQRHSAGTITTPVQGIYV